MRERAMAGGNHEFHVLSDLDLRVDGNCSKSVVLRWKALSNRCLARAFSKSE
jgi:hypothetical protein